MPKPKTPTSRKRETAKRLAQGEISNTERATWLRLFDTEKTSIQQFLECFKIKTDLEHLWIDGDPYVDVRLLPAQAELLQRCEAAWKRGTAYRTRIPKARRQGVSRFWNMFLGFERVLRVPGYETTLVGQDQDASEEHLSCIREFFEQIPKGVLKAMGITRLKGSATSFVFRHGNYKKSRVVVKTARKTGLGRGGQNNAIHMTERPHWPDQSKKDLSGFLRACANTPGNVIVDESTAMGLDEFYEDCMKAQKGLGTYDLFFIPSYRRLLNYSSFNDDDHFARFLKTVGKEATYGEHGEIQVINRVQGYWMKEGLDEEVALLRGYEYALWRRTTIDDDCKSVEVFWREEPTTLEEAFQGTGRWVLPREIITTWAKPAEAMQAKATRGHIRQSMYTTEYVSARDGHTLFLEQPTSSGEYVFGVDVSSGHLKVAGTGSEADWGVMTVKELWTGRTVARLRGHIYPRPFYEACFLLACHYNGAVGYVESNLATVLSLWVDEDEWEVDGYLPRDLLLESERKTRVDGKWISTPEYGWYTSEPKKHAMISDMVDFCMEWGAHNEANPHPRGSPEDFLTIQEMFRFVYDEKGKAAAEKGHDDCVIASGLALVSRKERFKTVETKSKVPTADGMTETERLFVRIDRERREDLAAPVLEYNPHTGKRDIVVAPSTNRNRELPNMPGF